MEMTKLSCEKFLAELASKAPTPGGGGTAALVGAAGVALGNMVGNLTTGKKKYAAVEADIQALNTKADALRKELEASKGDALAYDDKLVRDFIEKIEVFPEMMRFTMKAGMVTEVAM